MDNSGYWKNLPSEEIMGKNILPGEEFFEHLPQKGHILDLGCGNGEIAEFVAERGYEVIGIDINQEAIDLRNKSKSKGKYIVADVNQGLPFADNSFDGVIIAFLLVNILPSKKRRTLVKEINRVLKDGGIVWVNEPIISKEYEKRYLLSKPFVSEESDVISFKKGFSFLDITNEEEMRAVVAKGGIGRIIHHFTKDEIKSLFDGDTPLYSNETHTFSPRSNAKVNMEIAVFRKG